MEKSLKCLSRFVTSGIINNNRGICVLLQQCTINQRCTILEDKRLPPKLCANNLSSAAAVNTDSSKTGFLRRVKLYLQQFVSNDTKMNLASLKIYESIADGLDVREFFHYFQLPDTFQSWFLVIQLHIWMTMVRTVGERNGRFMRTKLAQVMWNDVEARVHKLTEIQRSVRKESIKSMYEQFQAALISYDEGLFSEDTVLAAAVWRTIFVFEYRDPRLLESMVIYIRKQMDHLDTLNTDELMYNGSISWIPLKEIVLPMDSTKC